MMKKLLTILLLLSFYTSYSQVEEPAVKNYKLEHKIVAGFNFGATAPVPIPEEVRSIEGWWPQFGAQLGYNILLRENGSNWSIGSGILLDYKGMGVKDKVKYMHTIVDIEQGDETGKFEGYFTGKNKTTVKSSYITIPAYVTYYIKEKWRLRLGAYVSYLFSSEFSGEVTDGYIREGDYSGRKIMIDFAQFSFGDKVRSFDFGLTGGGEFKFNNRFGFYTNLSWGLTSIFKRSFKGVGFKMYNIYAAAGMTYTL